MVVSATKGGDTSSTAIAVPLPLKGKAYKAKPLSLTLKRIKESGILYTFPCVFLVGANESAPLIKIGKIGVDECLKRDTLLGR